MADFDVLFQEEQRIPVTFRTENAYHWDVVFQRGEQIGPIVFRPPEAAIPVSFMEDDINDSIFGGVNYIVYDHGDLPVATKQRLGCVIVGENLSVEENGTLSADAAQVDSLTNMEIEALLGGS